MLDLASEEAAGRLLPRRRLLFGYPASVCRRLLVTGGSGTLGQLVRAQQEENGARSYSVDVDDGIDVRDQETVEHVVRQTRPTGIVHLAAHKHASMGEMFPAAVADVNIRGTEVVARVAEEHGVPMVLASTCKAADPATAYGASKLIAERVAVEHGHRAVRLVNVLGSSGSVLPIWARIPKPDPLPVVYAKRMWMTPGEAVGALLAALTFPAGVYVPDVGVYCEWVRDLANRAYPDRTQARVPLRRGDRPVERLVAEGERVVRPCREHLYAVVQEWQSQPEEGTP